MLREQAAENHLQLSALRIAMDFLGRMLSIFEWVGDAQT
jgi:hypothetical protein